MVALLYEGCEPHETKWGSKNTCLSSSISVQLRMIIACYRLNSHHLEVEQDRHNGIERTDRICQLCGRSSIENSIMCLLLASFMKVLDLHLRCR